MNTRIKAVFFDMDGTVFSHTSGSVPDSALLALKKLRERGVLLFCATGRHRRELEDLGCADLDFDGWLTLNGSCCYNKEGVFYSCPIDRDDVQVMIRKSGEYGFPVLFCEEEDMYLNREDELIRQEMAEIHTPMPPVRKTESSPEKPVYMMVPYCGPEIWEKISREMHAVKASLWSRALDVMSSAGGKAAGVRETILRYGLNQEETMAVGDGPNDTELFQACGYSVCMGNGTQGLKLQADYVTDHIDEDGLYHAMVRLGLIQEEK
jgi:Cof subfamily protein (haloacid dehalogenase superfamily)